MEIKRIIKIFTAGIFLFAPVFVLAASVSLANPSINPFTGAASSNPDVGSLVRDFYNFALMAAGVLAMGSIIYGAILYTISSGNPNKQSDAKDWITQALLGILLLLAAYLVLSTINPQITALQINTGIATTPANQSPSSAFSCPGGTTYSQILKSCTFVPTTE